MTDRPATFLYGGGWDPSMAGLYGEFLAACASAEPEIACLILDEGDGVDHRRFADALLAAGPCRPRPVVVRIGEPWDGRSTSTARSGARCRG